MKKSIKIVNLKIDLLTVSAALDHLATLFARKSKSQISTINPEFVVLANDLPDFLETLNRSDMRLADGTGILIAAKFLSLPLTRHKWLRGLQALIQLKWCVVCSLIYPKFIKYPVPQRISGSDFTLEILKFATSKNLKVFLLGAGPGVVETVSLKLQTDIPDLKISGIYSGSPKIEEEQNIIKLINKNKSDIIFVAFGSPAQEMWIKRNLKKTTAKLAIGVGGTFDFIAGRVNRAPEWMQTHGLEWLYRLIKEPRKRFVRQLALIRFLYLVYKSKLNK